jgi:hypothetical protein
MTFVEFEQIAESSNWDILVWNKNKAYKITGRAEDKSHFSVNALDGMDYQIINRYNYDQFEVQFSGEMQAAFHFIRKAIMEELSYKLGNSL